MKVENYQFPKSSFLSIEKDCGIIVNQMLKDDRLKKLLYYTTPDCLNKSNLTEEQSLSLFGKNIKLVPKLQVDGEVLNYIIISFDNFIPNASNTEFRDNIICFDIVCHFDQWNLKDFQLRPYRIAAEIDTLFNNRHLTGIGLLEFIGANQIVLTSEFAGLSLMFRAVHGEDDKKHPLNPNDEIPLKENFDKIFNNK